MCFIGQYLDVHGVWHKENVTGLSNNEFIGTDKPLTNN